MASPGKKPGSVYFSREAGKAHQADVRREPRQGGLGRNSVGYRVHVSCHESDYRIKGGIPETEGMVE